MKLLVDGNLVPFENNVKLIYEDDGVVYQDQPVEVHVNFNYEGCVVDVVAVGEVVGTMWMTPQDLADHTAHN